MSSIPLKPLPATRDVYPEDMRLRQWLFGHMQAVAESFGFQAYDACVLEHEELYVRKAGDEITDQLFNFVDKGERKVTLRPEMTPSLARMVMARQGSLALPLRWYAIPQCFRYERQQRGRKREHYQWNMDIIGLETVAAEVELMTAQATLLQRLGIDLAAGEVVFKISDRRVLQSFLAELDIVDDRFAAACVIIDKVDKIGRESTAEQLGELSIPTDVANRILDVLELDGIDALAQAVGDDNPGVQSLRRIVELAAATGIGDALRIDPSVVRGLSYYTGTVWEVFAGTGTFKRAIAGGGRYDALLKTLGGKPAPMVGFGFGDIPIVELLIELDRMPDLQPSCDVMVYPMSDNHEALAFELASALRKHDHKVSVDLTFRRFKHAVARAEADGAKHLLILGDSEVAKGECGLRKLDGSKEQVTLTLDQVRTGSLV